MCMLGGSDMESSLLKVSMGVPPPTLTATSEPCTPTQLAQLDDATWCFTAARMCLVRLSWSKSMHTRAGTATWPASHATSRQSHPTQARSASRLECSSVGAATKLAACVHLLKRAHQMHNSCVHGASSSAIMDLRLRPVSALTFIARFTLTSQPVLRRPS